MTRRRGELPEPEEELLGIERPSLEEEEEAERQQREKGEFAKVFLRNLMASDVFREWLMGWLTAFGTFENAFGTSPAGFPDPNATFFKAGMKAAGWALWEQVDDIAPDLASLMRREAGKPR